MTMALAIILLLACVAQMIAVVVVAAIVKDVILQINENKQYLEAKKAELEQFVNEKQAFVQDLEDRIRNSTLGSFLHL